MWTIVMYDLPITTREDAGAANRFTNLLADLGFVRVQYSVYARYTPTQSGGRSALNYIKAGIPPHGNVRVLCVTDIQWANSLKFIDKKTAEDGRTTGSVDSFRRRRIAKNVDMKRFSTSYSRRK